MATLAGIRSHGIPDPTVPRGRTALAEWPTWTFWATHFAGFGALTYFWNGLPAWISIPALAYLICFHAHLTHELIHGHPTRSRTLNRLLMLPNLTGWVPYEIYRDSHIAHHETAYLTHPLEDPESYYVPQFLWDRLPRVARWLLTANNTMIGRMILGPPLIIAQFYRYELKRFLRGDFRYAGAWTILAISNAVLGYWLFVVCGMPVLDFCLAFYGGISLMLVRSFTEHRIADSQDERCAIVEAGPVMQLLFLNNCFHLVHHDRPSLAWYEIPRVYAADRETWRARTGGHWFRGYWDVFRRAALTPKDSPRFPN